MGNDGLVVAATHSRSQLDLGRDMFCLFGLVFDVITLDDAVQRVHDAVAARSPCFISTPNVNFIVASQRDTAFRDSVLHSDLSLADGMPLVWAARGLGIPLSERVAGSDLFERLCLPNPGGNALKVFFFGGPDGVAERAADRLNEQAGGLRCVGFDAPGFGSVEEMSGADRIARINVSGADFLVVALGAKKGQAWIEHNRRRWSVPVVSHLGAVVNFVAGNVARAPAFLQRIGLEWAWRIKEEPALWKRYGSDGLTLLRLVFTRLLPCAMAGLWRRSAFAPSSLDARFEIVAASAATVVRLHGDWTEAALGPLRYELARLLRAGHQVQFDLAGTRWLDNACVALLMVLDRWQHAPRIVEQHSVPAAIRRLLHRHGADFLLHR